MKERAKKKIVIVDDNELYRQSLKRLLVDFDIIGEKEGSADGKALVLERRAHI
jgi:hypothetical protein